MIGRWRGPREARGDVTLVWGVPLGAGMPARRPPPRSSMGRPSTSAGSSQARRFTLVALDAVEGLAPESLYLEIKLWGKRTEPLAVESLYEAE